MRDRHSALDVVNYDGLCVAAVVRARRAVADVSEGDAALAERCESALAENIVYKPEILVALENSAVIHRYPAGLLTAVLQCVQTVVYVARYSIADGRRVDAENSAFFV